MNPSETVNPFDAFITSTTPPDQNVNMQVENATSSSQVSPIQQSESIMNYEWPQMEASAPVDWTQYAQQGESIANTNVADITPNVNNSNIISTNSQTVTPSEINDLVNNLDINANHHFTSNDINKLAYEYVKQKGELIQPAILAVTSPSQERLA